MKKGCELNWKCTHPFSAQN